MTEKPVSHIPPYGLRMQADLRDRLERYAAKSGRSLHAEIVHRLEQSFVTEDAERTARENSYVLQSAYLGQLRQELSWRSQVPQNELCDEDRGRIKGLKALISLKQRELDEMLANLYDD